MNWYCNQLAVIHGCDGIAMTLVHSVVSKIRTLSLLWEKENKQAKEGSVEKETFIVKRRMLL
jgi:hypothetical protein